MPEMASVVRYRAGVPVYQYRADPAAPPVSVLRFGGHDLPGHGQRPIHDLPGLGYVERAGRASGGAPPRPMRDGDAYVLAPGAVIDPAAVATVEAGWGVFFDPGAFGDAGPPPWSPWRAHPLLFPFLHGLTGGVLRLRVPRARQPVWATTIA